MIDVYRQVDSWREDNEAGRERMGLRTHVRGTSPCIVSALASDNGKKHKLSSVERSVLLIDLIQAVGFYNRHKNVILTLIIWCLINLLVFSLIN